MSSHSIPHHRHQPPYLTHPRRRGGPSIHLAVAWPATALLALGAITWSSNPLMTLLTWIATSALVATAAVAGIWLATFIGAALRERRNLGTPLAAELRPADWPYITQLIPVVPTGRHRTSDADADADAGEAEQADDARDARDADPIGVHP